MESNLPLIVEILVCRCKDGRSDTDASTTAIGAESAIEKSSLKRFTLEKGDLTMEVF
ncbi:hypothetical protein F2Q69_00036101 [Brassica cretica]|uniref:Uncharacterized protein n=1 Tax=Brassica cretica TaxID=69181 RepID=A0A8S9SKS2_BRACR|nr:hypothetical protein F2Q69_00036101 [Brassica cretica]